MTRLLPILTLVLATLFISCNDTTKEKAEAYFGGEIINPKEDFVVLFKDEVPIDTLGLDENNRFYYSFDKLIPGLYSFVHSEFQYVHIEPQDSIFLRLNTLEFDETLTFTGKGALKNNFLIKSYLRNENSSEKWKKVIQKYNPEDFKRFLKAEQGRRIKNLDRYNNKYNFSESFNDLAQVNINYHYYTLLEQYPMYNYEYRDSILPNYYSYRYHTQLDLTEYISLYPYWNYLYSFTDKISKDLHYSKAQVENYKESKFNYTLTNIDVIDSLIKNQDLKNMVLNRAAKNFISKTGSVDDATQVLTYYSKFNSSEENNNKLSKLISKIERLSKGKKIPNMELTSLKNEKTAINSVINKPTVLYFWSSNHLYHLKKVKEKVEKYSHETPYQFIGISIDEDLNTCSKTIKRFSIDENDFIFSNQDKAKEELLLHLVTKVFVLDKDATILDSELNIFSPNFKEELLHLQNNSLAHQD